MPKRRSVPLRQLDELIRLMEMHRDVAVGRLLGGSLAHQQASRTWATIGNSLNSMANGSTKTSDQWKSYWHELKYRARKRAREVRVHASGTGGGPGGRPLTDIETRILGILGPVSYEGNPSVRIPINVAEVPDQNPPLDRSVQRVQERPVPEQPVPEQPVPQQPVPDLPPPDIIEDSSSTDSNPTARRGRQADSSRQAQRQDRPRQYRQMSADPPRWARQYEERRLQIDGQRAQSQVRIVEVLERIDDVLRRILTHLEIPT